MQKLIVIAEETREVLEHSEIARTNKSYLIAQVWQRRGLRLTDEQLLHIMSMNDHVNPESILRAGRRYRNVQTLTSKLDKSSTTVDAPAMPQKPRKKLFGIL